MSKKPPDDFDELVRQLGYNKKILEALEEKHGDKLFGELKKRWRGRQEKRRLLHRDSSHGYTDEPALSMPNEPEAVSEEDQRLITAEAHEREFSAAELAQLEREQQTLAVKLNEIRAEAAERKIDLSKDIRVIERRLQAIEKKQRAA